MAKRLAVILAAAILVGSLAGCDAGPESDEVLVDAEPSVEEVTGTRLWVQLPTGRLSVTVGEPTTTIPAAESRVPDDGRTQDIVAEDGQVFLPLQLEETPGAGVPGVIYESGMPEDTVEPKLSIRIDGQDFYLGTTETLGTLPAYARVDESDGDSPIGLVVDFDGVTQSVDEDGNRDTGAAAGLYEQPKELPQQPCRSRWEAAPDASTRVECIYVVGHYPYLTELGWASDQEPGSTWAFIATATSLNSVKLANGRECRAGGLEASGTATLDGEPAAATLTTFNNPNAAGSFVSQGQAFPSQADATQHQLAIERTHPCESGGKLRELRLSTSLSIDSR